MEREKGEGGEKGETETQAAGDTAHGPWQVRERERERERGEREGSVIQRRTWIMAL